MTERHVPSVAKLLRSSGYVMRLTFVLHLITVVLQIFCYCHILVIQTCALSIKFIHQ